MVQYVESEHKKLLLLKLLCKPLNHTEEMVLLNLKMTRLSSSYHLILYHKRNSILRLKFNMQMKIFKLRAFHERRTF